MLQGLDLELVDGRGPAGEREAEHGAGEGDVRRGGRVLAQDRLEQRRHQVRQVGLRAQVEVRVGEDRGDEPQHSGLQQRLGLKPLHDVADEGDEVGEQGRDLAVAGHVSHGDTEQVVAGPEGAGHQGVVVLQQGRGQRAGLPRALHVQPRGAHRQPRLGLQHGLGLGPRPAQLHEVQLPVRVHEEVEVGEAGVELGHGHLLAAALAQHLLHVAPLEGEVHVLHGQLPLAAVAEEEGGEVRHLPRPVRHVLGQGAGHVA